jgi:hypothetical protein
LVTSSIFLILTPFFHRYKIYKLFYFITSFFPNNSLHMFLYIFTFIAESYLKQLLHTVWFLCKPSNFLLHGSTTWEQKLLGLKSRSLGVLKKSKCLLSTNMRFHEIVRVGGILKLVLKLSSKLSSNIAEYLKNCKHLSRNWYRCRWDTCSSKICILNYNLWGVDL